VRSVTVVTRYIEQSLLDQIIKQRGDLVLGGSKGECQVRQRRQDAVMLAGNA
jgi:hypothetical protein